MRTTETACATPRFQPGDTVGFKHSAEERGVLISMGVYREEETGPELRGWFVRLGRPQGSYFWIREDEMVPVEEETP